MEKMKMETVDGVSANIDKIAELFPNCIVEASDNAGGYKRSVNFAILKQMLSEDVVEGDEAYELTWVGKKASIVEAGKPIRKTLRPCVEKSIKWDTTRNLYIEGDNLEALKLLQESYLNKVKMIYIDPPYNTGHDFVYPDTFIMDNEEYNDGTGYYDEEGNINYSRKNTEREGKYHSDWCSMIYSRLILARNLLADDGVIFISINDYEVDNLRKICDEVFGRKNLIANFCWRTDGNFDNQAKVKICHEYILMYAKEETLFKAPPVVDPNISEESKLNNDYIRNTIVKNGVKNPISEVVIPAGFPCEIDEGTINVAAITWPKYDGDIHVKNGRLEQEVIAKTGWASKGQLLEFINNGFEEVIDTKGQKTRFLISKTGAIESIKERKKEQSHVISVLQGLGGPQKATTDMGDLGDFFDYPKPVVLLKYLIKMLSDDENAIIMDFFSGSGTLAQAVIELNEEDKKDRSFILVQVQEPTAEDSAAKLAGFDTICAIAEERIKNIGRNISDQDENDVGFRVFEIADSNMNDIYYSADRYSQGMIAAMESNIKPDRTDLDLLFGCVIDWGLPLSLPYSSEEISGVKVHTYNDGDLIACFDENVPEDVVREIAKRQPLRAVFRDSCFSNSPAKINVGEIFKAIAPDTSVKVI